ncbi:MAG: hypothetical protein HYZ16_09530 [Bacteroidetes bacterium]|jgi:pyrimidine operon attenuation protein/uracil phosphoribosyltransferase|nr:hypothetical protein [Bacteroidota bacterium]
MLSKQILDNEKAGAILRRMSIEIWEKNFKAERIILVGIADKGFSLANTLADTLEQVGCSIPVLRWKLQMDKERPLDGPLEIRGELPPAPGDAVVVVDDVLYTGKTLMHAMLPFVHRGHATIQLAVLVFRDYLRYPIRPDFIGISLASTIMEHVEVRMDAQCTEAYLN